jgi:hypothetical protein
MPIPRNQAELKQLQNFIRLIVDKVSRQSEGESIFTFKKIALNGIESKLIEAFEILVEEIDSITVETFNRKMSMDTRDSAITPQIIFNLFLQMNEVRKKLLSLRIFSPTIKDGRLVSAATTHGNETGPAKKERKIEAKSSESVLADANENEKTDHDEYEIFDPKPSTDSFYEEKEGHTYYWEEEGIQYSQSTPRRRLGDAMVFALRSKGPQLIPCWSPQELNVNENSSIFRLLVGRGRLSPFVQRWYKSSCAVVNRSLWGENQIVGTGSLINPTMVVTAKHPFETIPIGQLFVRFFHYEILPINKDGEYPIKEFYLDIPVTYKHPLANGLDAGYLQIPLMPDDIFQHYMKVLPIDGRSSRLLPGYYVVFHFAGGHHQVSIGCIPLSPSDRPAYLHNDIDLPAGNGGSGAVVINTGLTTQTAMGHGLLYYRLRRSSYGEPSRRLIAFSKFHRSHVFGFDRPTVTHSTDDSRLLAVPYEFADGSGYEWYSGIVGIEQSLLIISVLNKETGKKAKELASVLPVVSSVEELKKYFNSLIDMIQNAGEITLRKGDNFFINSHFRVDVGNSPEGWLLDIQDNTGKGKKIQGKSLSSVFAKVKIPKGKNSISGKDLAELFLASQKDKVAKDPSSLEKSAEKPKHASMSSSSSKQRSEKNKQKYLEEKKKQDAKYLESTADKAPASSSSLGDEAKEREGKDISKTKPKTPATVVMASSLVPAKAAAISSISHSSTPSAKAGAGVGLGTRSSTPNTVVTSSSSSSSSSSLGDESKDEKKRETKKESKSKDQETKTGVSGVNPTSSSSSSSSAGALDVQFLRGLIAKELPALIDRMKSLKVRWDSGGKHIATHTASINGERKQFSEYDVRGDGDCGFTVLGISRQDVVNTLMELKDNEAKRRSIINELVEAFELFNDARDEERDPTEYMDSGIRTRFIGYYNRLTTARNEGGNTEAILEEMAEDIGIFTSYVQSYNPGDDQQGLWLGVESMRCIAEQKRIGLTIFGERDDNKELHPLPRSVPPIVAGGPCVYVMLRGGHYNFLVDEGVALREEKAKTVTKAASRPFKASGVGAEAGRGATKAPKTPEAPAKITFASSSPGVTASGSFFSVGRGRFDPNRKGKVATPTPGTSSFELPTKTAATLTPATRSNLTDSDRVSSASANLRASNIGLHAKAPTISEAHGAPAPKAEVYKASAKKPA